MTAVALLTTSCAGAGGSGTSSPTDVVVLASDDPSTYTQDSGGTGGRGQGFVIANTQANLVRNRYVTDQATGLLEQDWVNFEGLLAESWDVSPDGLLYTFHLRKGLRSQAGNELSADDVLWSMERHFNTETAAAKFVFKPYVDNLGEQLTKVDDHTVALRLKRSGDGVTVLSLLSDMDTPIFDSTLLKSKASAADPYAVTWTKSNSGTGFGAYKVESHAQGESVVLTANPDFALGAPAVKRITMRIVADAGTRASAVQAGDADMALDLLPAQLNDLKANKSVQTFELATNQHMKMPMITSKAPFDNPAVRQAMGYAVPYDQIVDKVFRGRASRMGQVLSRDSQNYDGRGVEPLAYDPAKAQQILRDAGIKQPVQFALTVSSGVPDAVDAAVVIQSFAKDAGFDVKVNQLSPADYAAGRSTAKFQAFLDRDSAMVMTPPYQLRLWTDRGSPFNLANWESEAFYTAMGTALTYPDAVSVEAMQSWNAVERVMRAEMPMAFFAYLYPSDAVRAGITGYAPRSDSAIDFSIVRKG
ncbi:ABC transporter substrate-binding protein [Nocardia sp. NPDC058379]|uniref:ABC transporter substrate-binding protein n=1 Tax=unclassified Nocardia TaxID=2637762 RepID=UPI003652917C